MIGLMGGFIKELISREYKVDLWNFNEIFNFL